MSEGVWKVLIIDDEVDVHDVSVMALRRLDYEHKKIRLYHAYTAKEAFDLLRVEKDIAVALIDVVMESDTAGLDLVKSIREGMGNEAIRLIVRTGNPGLAPEEGVILTYDINDYRAKAELTAQSLRTAVIAAIRSYKAIRTITALNKELDETQQEVLYTLSEIAESRSNETGHHVERVSKITGLIARELGYDDDAIAMLKLASSMHDIGKIAIDDRILNKPGRLTEEEFEVIKKHSSFGHDILKNSERKLLKMAAIIAHEHHENYDGSGYPRGLKGDEINELSKVVAIVDVYDALTIKRVYKEAWPKEDVYGFIKEQEGIKFDPKIVKIFFENIKEIEEISESLL